MGRKTRSKQWSASEAGRILDQADASGVSDAEFCRKLGVSSQRLSWWRLKLGRRRRKGSAKPSAAPAFVELQARAVPKVATRRPSRTADAIFSIYLANGRSVDVPESVDIEWLGRLLAVVEGRTC